VTYVTCNVCFRKTVLGFRNNVRAERCADPGKFAPPRERGTKGLHPAHFPGEYTKAEESTMRNLKQAVIEFIREEEGLTVVEYAIAGGLVGLGVIAAFDALGGEVDRIISGIVAALATVDLV
jgi:pilus assembly protein Flp/PilA